MPRKCIRSKNKTEPGEIKEMEKIQIRNYKSEDCAARENFCEESLRRKPAQGEHDGKVMVFHEFSGYGILIEGV